MCIYQMSDDDKSLLEKDTKDTEVHEYIIYTLISTTHYSTFIDSLRFEYLP